MEIERNLEIESCPRTSGEPADVDAAQNPMGDLSELEQMFESSPQASGPSADGDDAMLTVLTKEDDGSWSESLVHRDKFDFGENDALDFGENDALDFGENDALDFGENDALDFGENDALDFGENDSSDEHDGYEPPPQLLLPKSPKDPIPMFEYELMVCILARHIRKQLALKYPTSFQGSANDPLSETSEDNVGGMADPYGDLKSIDFGDHAHSLSHSAKKLLELCRLEEGRSSISDDINSLKPVLERIGEVLDDNPIGVLFRSLTLEPFTAATEQLNNLLAPLNSAWLFGVDEAEILRIFLGDEEGDVRSRPRAFDCLRSSYETECRKEIGGKIGGKQDLRRIFEFLWEHRNSREAYTYIQLKAQTSAVDEIDSSDEIDSGDLEESVRKNLDQLDNILATSILELAKTRKSKKNNQEPTARLAWKSIWFPSKRTP